MLGALRFVHGLGYRSARGWYLGGLLLACVGPLSLLILPLVASRFVDAVTLDEGAEAIPLAILLGAGGALAWMLTVLEASVSNGITTRVEMGFVLARARAVSDPETLEHLEDDETSQLMRDVEAGRVPVIQAPLLLTNLIGVVMRALVIFTFLAVTDARLVVLPIAASVPFVAETWLAKRRARREAARSTTLGEAMELFAVATSPDAASEVRVLGMQQQLLRRHDASTKQLLALERRLAVAEVAATALAWLIVGLSMVVALRWVALSAEAGEISPGAVVVTVILAQAAGSVLSAGAPLIARFRSSLHHVKSMIALSERSTSPQTRDEGKRFEPSSAGLVLRDVGFAYPNAETDALSGVCLDIPPGSSVAIVGSNGAGKSTLVKLILGLYKPTTGVVVLDGTSPHRGGPVRRFNAMFQDFERYELSAGLNVGVGDVQTMSEQSILDALAMVDGLRLVEDLPDGLETELSGTAGTGLSGGQWQRLAAGRTVLRRAPELMVLDEPTSSLDVESEDQLLSLYSSIAREQASQNATISIFVTHRLAMARKADLVVVLDRGRIVEAGPHEDLMDLNGTYAELYVMQASSYS